MLRTTLLTVLFTAVTLTSSVAAKPVTRSVDGCGECPSGQVCWSTQPECGSDSDCWQAFIGQAASPQAPKCIPWAEAGKSQSA